MIKRKEGAKDAEAQCLLHKLMLDPFKYDANLNTPAPEQSLDARGLKCPLPLLKAKQALHSLALGQRLAVWTSDPGSWDDFACYAKLSTHQLEVQQKQGDDYYFVFVRGI